MKILVMGGTYFLGKHFVAEAFGKCELTLFNRGTHKNEYVGESVHELRGDRYKQEDLQQLSGLKFDYVVDFSAYREGDIQVVLNALSGQVGKYIFVSTVDSLRRGSGQLLTEDSPLEDRDLGGEVGAYITGKALLEKELERECESRQIGYVAVKPAFIYGPDNYAPRESIFFQWIHRAGQVIRPTEGNRVCTGAFQLTYVKDVARLLFALCGQREELQLFHKLHICGDCIGYQEFFEELQEATLENFTYVDLSVEEVNAKGIPLPFPLTKAESEFYSNALLTESGFPLTSLKQGLAETYQWFLVQEGMAQMEEGEELTPQKVMERVDALLDSGKAKEAESFMIAALTRAEQAGDLGCKLAVRNEQIGYYRVTSEKAKLLPVLVDSLQTAVDLGLKGTIPYATTTLNVANGYRSIGEKELSLQYYLETETIYLAHPEIDEMLLAGLYNNMSLLREEMGDYQGALNDQKQALELAIAHKASFEIAATYSNLANTYAALGDVAASREHAREAVNRFEAMGSSGPHYCAALHALGLCHMQQGEYEQAAELFDKAMQLVEQSVGRNSQYDRLKEYCLACKEKSGGKRAMKGLESGKVFYETKGAPMLLEKFPAYVNQIAVGLVGQGSDCYGYDDEYSKDHDFGPGFCMWVTQETYDRIGEALQQAYEELVKQEEAQLDYKTNNTEAFGKRRGVFVIERFYQDLLGTTENPLTMEVSSPVIQEYALATAVNGQIFRDEEGLFTAIREHLAAGYSKSFRLKLLAQDVALVSQNLQYNYFRMMDRGDYFTADLMLANGMTAAMKLQHHICGKYAPHDKWLKRSLLDLPAGMELLSLLDTLRSLMGCTSKDTYAKNRDLAKKVTEEIGSLFAEEMYGLDDISDIDSYIDHHTEELMLKSFLETKTDEELVNMVVKLEFEAFDKVKNEGGRASCQNDWPTFYVMRKSQYLTWNRTMLLQYYYDFDREYRSGHNLITEKYGRMMESTAPEKYEEFKDTFPEISEQKQSVIQQIVAVQMGMAEEFAAEYPEVAGNARDLHTYEDGFMNTSMETYLRGEISTYSDKMLQLYGQYVVSYVSSGKRIAQAIIENTAKMYGYHSLEEFTRGTKS